ncbi:hypothetical protein RND81_14G080700 [Saponaria officinalis]|uniref:Polygalacturonase n=1 Tax=Saponaria officinalis TaxID=3572 RepID=A0AAW1GJ48_SAPOF
MFQDSANIELNGVKSVNSQLYHIVFDRCNKVILEGVTITASRDGPNTDGIHVEFSSDVTILHSNVGTGDDCVSVGPGTTRLWIEDMNCGPGHGISIGSLGKDKEEEGVEEVTVKSATFTATQNGVRIKSWARSSNGFVRKVLFQHITMINAQNPIIIDQHYCPRHLNCPHGVSGIQINDVTYQDIHGTSASEVGVTFDCSSKNPCQNIKLDDVDISYDGEKARLICDNVEGLR